MEVFRVVGSEDACKTKVGGGNQAVSRNVLCLLGLRSGDAKLFSSENLVSVLFEKGKRETVPCSMLVLCPGASTALLCE